MKLNKEAVKEKLTEVGWTYDKLAARIGVNNNTLRRWIGQDCTVPYKHIRQIADVLDCDYLEITQLTMY